MRGNLKVYYCAICKRELKKAHAKFCTFCGKLYAMVKLRKYAIGLNEIEIYDCVKRLHEWQRIRSNIKKVVS